jgi:hypothetical protein
MSSRTDRSTNNLACMRFTPKVESKHLPNDFTVNVFSIASSYMPLAFDCQAFSSVSVFAKAGKRMPTFHARVLGLRPATVRHDPGALSQRNQLIDG